VPSPALSLALENTCKTLLMVYNINIMSYTVLARKWRPQIFDEIVEQEHVSQTLKNAIASNRVSHAYLFAGPRGVGKTTMARILAKALNCKDGPTANPCGKCTFCSEITGGRSPDVIEIDGASNRGIDEIRNLRENVKFAPIAARKKIYIVDEVHMLTPEAFNALLKTLEEPPPHVVFIFATTEPHKIPLTILSRCQRFNFHLINTEKILSRLQFIVSQEKINIPEDALHLLARAGRGSLRDAQSLLDQVLSYAGESITIDQVRYVLGAVPFEVLVGLADSIKKRDSKSVFNYLQKAVDSGYDVHKLAEDLTALLREAFLLKIGVAENFQIAVTEEAQQELRSLTKDFTDAELEWAIEMLTRTYDLMKWSEQPRLLLEINLYKLAQGYVPLEDVIARLDELAASGLEPESAQREGVKQAKVKKTAAQPDIAAEYKSDGSGAAAVPDAFQKPQKETPSSGDGLSEFQVEWKKFLEHLRHTQTMGPRIYACLIEAKASSETTGRIDLEFPYEYHRKAIETSAQEIEKEYQNFTGNKVHFICRLRPQKSSDQVDSGMADAEPPVEAANGEATQTVEDLLEREPRLKRMTELFKGEITSWEKKKQ